MKKLSKVLVLVLSAIMVLAMSASVFAQTVPSGKGGSGEITIQNASKGIHYTVTKIFDATYNSTTKTVAYTYSGTLPTNDYFEQNATTGAITIKDAGKDAEGNLTANAAKWLNDNISGEKVVDAVEADGTEFKVTGLQYGYYLITSDLGTGTAISVDTTKPSATMYDKNENKPHFDEGQGKKANNTNVAIGETVTYTIDFTATNFTGAGEAAKKVVSYEIADTLPNYLSDVNVTKIEVNDGTAHDVTKQFTDKKIKLDWVDANGNSLYKNNAVITITYTAKVTQNAVIAGAGNPNKVTITPKDKDDNDLPGKIEDTETIKTYALAIKKVDEKGTPLPGATFEFPFAVTKVGDDYFVDASATTQKSTLTTPDTGILLIKGVKAGTYSVTETGAPEGYNVLPGPISVKATETSATTTNVTKYIDANGNITDTETEIVVEYVNNNIAADAVFVVNKAGAELPGTGGIGTTIFYVLGSLLVVGCGIVLISRKRMQDK